MLWCFGSAALLLTLLGVAALKINPLRLVAQLQPLLLVRGCIALSCLGVALGLMGLAVLIAR